LNQLHVYGLSSRKQLPLVSDQLHVGRHFRGWLLLGGWTVHVPVHTVQCILVNLMVRLVCTNVSAVIQLHVTLKKKQNWIISVKDLVEWKLHALVIIQCIVYVAKCTV